MTSCLRADGDEPAVSRPGDIWLAKDHRILCGDALDPESYRALLLDGEVVIQVVTDPPYNVSNSGHVSRKSFREFTMATWRAVATESSPTSLRSS